MMSLLMLIIIVIDDDDDYDDDGDDGGVDDDNDADVVMMCKRSLAPTKGVSGRGPEEGGRVGETLFFSHVEGSCSS